MADTASLGDRMKAHEHVTRYTLPQRTYTILRVDGKSFHSYLKGATKPFDYSFILAMDTVAAKMCAHISGAVFAYTQSDEISILLQDFQSQGTQPWFGGNVQKMASISAASATAYLNEIRGSSYGTALFDGRVFTVSSRMEVLNYFLWRQRDAVRNSISMAAQAKFSHRQLQNKNSDEMQEMLFKEHGINWSEYPDRARRGGITLKSEEERTGHKGTPDGEPVTYMRSTWKTKEAFHFSPGPGLLNTESLIMSLIPKLEDA